MSASQKFFWIMFGLSMAVIGIIAGATIKIHDMDDVPADIQTDPAFITYKACVLKHSNGSTQELIIASGFCSQKNL